MFNLIKKNGVLYNFIHITRKNYYKSTICLKKLKVAPVVAQEVGQGRLEDDVGLDLVDAQGVGVRHPNPGEGEELVHHHHTRDVQAENKEIIKFYIFLMKFGVFRMKLMENICRIFKK